MAPEQDAVSGPSGRAFIRQHGAAAAGMLTALVLVVVAGPAVADQVGDELQHESVAAPLPTASAPPPTEVDTTLPPATTEPVTSPTVTPPAPPPATDGPATTAPAPVTRIQTVPAERDVIIEVDGERFATDNRGFVALTGTAPDATVRVVGLLADPPIQAVEFSRWGDGSLDPARTLDTIDGPVAQIGLTVYSRVLVDTDDERPVGTTASFTSNLRDLDVALGRPTWIPAAIAVPSPTGLVPLDVTYTLTGLPAGAAVPAQEFRPTPEATWLITT